MREETYFALLNLKSAIKSDERYLLLLKKEKETEEDKEVQLLAYKKDVACDKYNDMLKLFSDDSKEVKEARVLLYNAKRELESHPKVREYFLAYTTFKNILEQVRDILFEDLSLNLCPKKD